MEGGLADGTTADGRAAAAEGAHRGLGQRRVAEAERQAVRAHPEGVGGDLGQHRVYALAHRDRATDDGDAAVRLDPDGAALPAGRGVLDEGRETDPDELAVCSARGLSLTQTDVLSRTDQPVEQTRVIAAVVRRAVRGPVREVGRLEKVAAADLDRVDSELAGDGVDEALDDVRRLGP